MNWIAQGSPSGAIPIGRLTAGQPAMFASAVKTGWLSGAGWSSGNATCGAVGNAIMSQSARTRRTARRASSRERLLRSIGVDTILIGGTKTNICCESTARDALQASDGQLSRLRAEAQALTDLLGHGVANQGPGIVDALEVDPGYEAALGAALGDEVWQRIQSTIQQ